VPPPTFRKLLFNLTFFFVQTPVLDGQDGRNSLQCYPQELRIFDKIFTSPVSSPFPLRAPVQILWLRRSRVASWRFGVETP
jgi:hypothetical protein